ncbi:MAG: ATP-dependent Clp protease ATP-binding subunit, partial [Clostridia bacterium]|nr:ATP-dependent Clp protease ATP-binding subunit [Clostridia bacterium]
TTIEEYRKYIEKDSALERRFTPVNVDEPSIDDAIGILKGLRSKYEQHHGIVISDEAIEAAVKLSSRYITDRFLPDKAIDLIDEAAARARIVTSSGAQDSTELYDLTNFIARKEAERARLEQLGDVLGANRAEKEKKEAEERKATIEQAQALRKLPDGRYELGKEQVAAIVSARMKIPLMKITQEEGEKLMRLESDLHKRIIGQNEAVSAVSKAIRRARAGLKDPSRPIGSFIFVGPTGVGKTDLCKALAETMFGSEDQMIRLDMSEYMEKQSVSKLIGAPPGYAGYDDAQTGQLTDKIRTHPYSVVLFDEIEKAHPDVFNLLLQILDDGRLTDSKGRTVSFKNAIVILTSNIGAVEAASDRTGVYGFGGSGVDSGANEMSEREYDSMKDRIKKALKERFRPEFLNRMDDIIVFHALSEADCEQIAGKIIEGLAKRLLEQRGVYLTVTAAAKAALVKEGYDPQYGARPLKRVIQRRIEDKLSEEILVGKIRNGQRVTVDVSGGEFVVFAV